MPGLYGKEALNHLLLLNMDCDVINLEESARFARKSSKKRFREALLHTLSLFSGGHQLKQTGIRAEREASSHSVSIRWLMEPPCDKLCTIPPVCYNHSL